MKSKVLAEQDTKSQDFPSGSTLTIWLGKSSYQGHQTQAKPESDKAVSYTLGRVAISERDIAGPRRRPDDNSY
jgi:hypothetical protein